MVPSHSQGNSLTPLLQGTSLIVSIVFFQVAVARWRLDREAKRRFQHAITGHSLVLVSYYLPQSLCIFLLAAGAAGIRYIRMFQSETYLRYFGPLLRPHELLDDTTTTNKSKNAKVLPGAFYFLVSSALVATVFPISTARVAVECLSLADPMAAWAGQSIASPKLWPSSSSSWVGTTACFLTAWCIGYAMLRIQWTNDTDEPPVSLFCITCSALACCLAEAFPHWNDNLTIPIVTAIAIELSR